MPEICHFQGIKIYVYYRDHARPHIHAEYVGDWAVLDIADGHLVAGRLPRHTLGVIRRWLRRHRAEVHQAWNRAERGDAPGTIDSRPRRKP